MLNKPISLIVYNMTKHVRAHVYSNYFLTRQYSNIVHDINELKTDTFKLLFQSIEKIKISDIITSWKYMISSFVEVKQIIIQMQAKST